MIRLCTCIGMSSSSLHNPNNTDNSKACKSCGGELTANRQGPFCGSMLKTIGLELPRPIDPEVKWKTTSRRRQRAVRRARTSFSGEDKVKAAIRTLCSGNNAIGQESNAQDAPVSESEKLGVSILGRRFSDPIENVPIKKRRFLISRSPSPPPSLSEVDQFEHILSSSCGDISSYGKHRKGRMLRGGEFCSKEAKKGLSDAADFSGISILAAAACESGMEGGILNGECSKSDHSLKERKLEDIMRSTELSFLHDIKEKSKILHGSHCKIDSPLEPSASAPDIKPSIITTLNSSDNLDESASAPEANSSVFSASNYLNNPDGSVPAPDAKSSVVTALNCATNPGEHVDCLQATVEKTKRVDSARDSRLHWDLNVAMEVWDKNGGDDDIVGSDAAAAAVRECNGAENEINRPQICQSPFDSVDTRDIPGLSGDKIHAIDVPEGLKMQEETVICHDSSPLLSCSSAQNMQLLESAPLIRNGSSEETNDFLDQQKTSCASEVESHLGSNPVCSSLDPITEHAVLTSDVENADGSHSVLLRCEGLSHIPALEGLRGGNSIRASQLGSRVECSVSKPVSEESTNLVTVSVFNKSFGDHGLNGTQLGQGAQQSISEFEKQELLDVDSGSSKIDLSINKKAEDGSDGLCIAEKAPEADTVTNLSALHPEDNLESADLDMMTYEHTEGVAAHSMIDDNNCSINDASTTSAKTGHVITAVSQDPAPNLGSTKPAITDTDGAVHSEATAKSYINGSENKLGKVASNDCLHHCYDSGASCIGKDLAGMGKADVEEDDSQYEDGELRESGNHYWADDGFEEVEHVDYDGPDYKDDNGASDIPPLPVETISNKTMGFPAAGNDGIQSRKNDSDAAASPILLNCSSSRNYLDSVSGKRCAESSSEKSHSAHLRLKGETRAFEMDTNLLIAGSTATDSRIQRGNDGLGDYLSSIRTKSTGWDRLPEGLRCSRHGSGDGVDSANRSVLTTFDAAKGGDSSRQIRLSSNRDVQSRIERPTSFDGPRRYDLCRSDDGYRSGSKAERTIGTQRTLGRGRASWHIHVHSRGEQWVENPNRSGPVRHRSPDYYGYGPPGPRNAAEAAVAKMESNGFVVAPDGTLVKAVDAATAGHMPRRMRNSSLNSSHHPGRGSVIDRDGACAMSRGSTRAREASPDRNFAARARQRSFSPNRASLHLARARTRSPSRSRSRSPRVWSSPRGRRDVAANGGSSLRRRSRSPPSYRAEIRVDRMTSPRRRPAFEDQMSHYSPSSRDHTYSQHARWVDGRKCSPVNPRDHNKRHSGRSPPLRITSRNDRFDLMDSQGRPRPGEFYQLTQGRFSSYGFDRENKHDGNGDDRREYADRYETLHSVRPYDRNGTVKQFRNDAGDGSRPHNSAPKSPELQRRGSPRRFERGFERHLAADLPRGSKEEKDPYKYD